MARLVLITAAAFAAAFASASAAAAQSNPGVRYVPAHPRNYPHAPRPTSLVRYVVVHTIEGSYWGAISWFRNPRARVSSHYVVGRNGDVTQMVSERRAAWHAGNGWINRRSIGVEHEGYAGIVGTLTDAEYRASARVVANVMRHYVLPIDRRRVIGHNEVPHPSRPWRLGGWGGHTDPGRHWDWARYLSYVRAFATGRTPPPRAFDVTVPSLAIGQRLRGVVPWEAVPTGAAPARVDFLINGRLYDTRRQPPYQYGGGIGWDTTRAANGRHTLTARAVAADGRVAHAAVVVRVRNDVRPPAPPPPPTETLEILDLTLVHGQRVSGSVRWEATIKGTPQRVEFLIDGVLRDTQTAPPYAFGGATGGWDTTRESAGEHELTVRAVGARTTTEETILVFVTPPSR